MRIWSLHPRYLDSKGLVALWRESLLARSVLAGNTKGYRNHPQLLRFKNQKDPVMLINQYLATVYEVAQERGYHFNKEKIDWNFTTSNISLTEGQLEFERQHLLTKLKIRDKDKYEEVSRLKEIVPHPIFKLVNGDIEGWEKT
jgi:hypothetical protein